MPNPTTPEQLIHRMPTPEEAKIIADCKGKIMHVKSRLVGSLELQVLLITTLLERTQHELEQERQELSLLVREHAGLLTSEEQRQLDERMGAPSATAPSPENV